MGIAVRRDAELGSLRRGLMTRMQDCSTPKDTLETITNIRCVCGGGGWAVHLLVELEVEEEERVEGS